MSELHGVSAVTVKVEKLLGNLEPEASRPVRLVIAYCSRTYVIYQKIVNGAYPLTSVSNAHLISMGVGGLGSQILALIIWVHGLSLDIEEQRAGVEG